MDQNTNGTVASSPVRKIVGRDVGVVPPAPSSSETKGGPGRKSNFDKLSPIVLAAMVGTSENHPTSKALRRDVEDRCDATKIKASAEGIDATIAALVEAGTLRVYSDPKNPSMNPATFRVCLASDFKHAK